MKMFHLPWMMFRVCCWPAPYVHLVGPKIFILLVKTEALKPEQLDIFHNLFGA